MSVPGGCTAFSAGILNTAPSLCVDKAQESYGGAIRRGSDFFLDWLKFFGLSVCLFLNIYLAFN